VRVAQGEKGGEAHLEVDPVVALDAGIEAERRIGPHADLAAAALDLEVLRVLAVARVDAGRVAVGEWLGDRDAEALDAEGVDRARVGRRLGRRFGADRAVVIGRRKLLVVVAGRALPGLQLVGRGVKVEALVVAGDGDPVVIGVVPVLGGEAVVARPDLSRERSRGQRLILDRGPDQCDVRPTFMPSPERGSLPASRQKLDPARRIGPAPRLMMKRWVGPLSEKGPSPHLAGTTALPFEKRPLTPG
jgi:hypothetical protein